MAKQKIKREQLFTMKVSEPEKEVLEKVSNARGLSSSALVRLLILDEARRLGVA